MTDEQKKIGYIIIIILASIYILLSVFRLGHNLGYRLCLSHVYQINVDLWLSYDKDHVALQRLGPVRPPILYEADIKDNIGTGKKITINLKDALTKAPAASPPT